MAHSAASRAAERGINVVRADPLADATEPKLPDDDGTDDNDADAMHAAAMLSVAMATKCFVVNPRLGDPVELARRFYDFIFE